MKRIFSLILGIFFIIFLLGLISSNSIIQSSPNSNDFIKLIPTAYFNVTTDFTASSCLYSLNKGINNYTMTKIIPSNSLCYQETANVSTSCGGLNTGNYSITDDGSSGYLYINYAKPLAAIGAIWQIKDDNESSAYNVTVPTSCWNYDSNYLHLRITSFSSISSHFFGVEERCQFSDVGWAFIGHGNYNMENIGLTESSPGLNNNMYDGNWNTYQFFEDVGNTWYSSCSGGSATCEFARIYEEAIIWNMSTSFWATNTTMTVPMANRTQFNVTYYCNDSANTWYNTSSYPFYVFPSACNLSFYARSYITTNISYGFYNSYFSHSPYINLTNISTLLSPTSSPTFSFQFQDNYLLNGVHQNYVTSNTLYGYEYPYSPDWGTFPNVQISQDMFILHNLSYFMTWGSQNTGRCENAINQWTPLSSPTKTVYCQPALTLYSPLNNQVYRDIYNFQLDLNSSATKCGAAPITYKYSLNGASNVTFTPNTTIIGVAGKNNLTVYVTDTNGTMDFKSITFNLTFTPQINDINMSNQTTSYDRNSFNTGLVAWYKFDENNGNNVFDSSIYGINGTINRTVFGDFEGTLDGFNLDCSGTGYYNVTGKVGDKGIQFYANQGSGPGCIYKSLGKTATPGYSVFFWAKGYVQAQLWNGSSTVSYLEQVDTGCKTANDTYDISPTCNGGNPYTGWTLFKLVVDRNSVANVQFYSYNYQSWGYSTSIDFINEGPSIANGNIGNGLAFSGFSSQKNLVTINNPQIDKFGQANKNYTISIWQYKDSNNDISAMEKWPSDPYPFAMRRTVCTVFNGSTYLEASYGNLGLNQWHLVTCTYDTNITAYVDGVRVASTVNTLHTQNVNNTGSFPIGARYINGDNSWNGMLDEARFYNRSLSATEVNNLYSITNPNFESQANVTISTNVTDAEGSSLGNFFFNWIVNGVTKLAGLGQSIFNFQLSSPQTNVTLIINDSHNYQVTQNFVINSSTQITKCGEISSAGAWNLTKSISSSGVCLNITADNVYVYGNGFTVTGSPAVVTNNNNDFFYSTILNSSGNAIQVMSGALQTILVNTTLTGAESVSGQLIREWYFDEQVNTSNGVLSGASVLGYDKSGTLVLSQTTGSNGKITTQILIDYINTGGTKVYNTPHVINTSYTGYNTNTTTYNITTLHNVNAFVLLTLINQAPSVTLVSPSDLTYSNSLTNSFTCSMTDSNNNLVNSTIYVGSSHTTQTISGGSNQTTISQAVGSSGTYQWNCLVCDNLNACSWASSNRTIYIDTSSPVVTLSYPYSGFNTTSTPALYANFTDSGYGIKNITFLVYSGNTVVYRNNQSYSLGTYSINTSMTPTTLSDGSYNWTFIAYDWAGNLGSTINKTIQIDHVAPVVNIVYPGDGDKLSNGTFSLNYTAFDATSGVQICKYTGDSGVHNTTTPCGQNISLILGDGSYIYTIYGIDYMGNTGYHTHSFTVNSVGPGINLNSPIGGAYLNSNKVYFNYTATDSNGIGTCLLYGNWSSYGLKYTWVNPNSGIMNSTNLSVSDGNYFWNVWCNDSLGNPAVTNNRSFIVDTVFPDIVDNGKTPLTVYTGNDVTFNATITDLHLSGVKIELNYSSGYSNTTITSLNNNYIAILTDVPNFVNISWRWWGLDLAGNLNSSQLNSFVVTNRNPGSVNITYPGPMINSNSTTIYFLDSDPDGDTLNCSLFNSSDRINFDYYNSTNGNSINFTGYNNTDTAITYYYINCSDSQLTSSSAINSFTINLIQPTITLVNPRDAASYKICSLAGIPLDYSTTGVNISYCELNVSYDNSGTRVISSHQIIPNCINTTFSISSGDNLIQTLDLYIYDLAGNTNYAEELIYPKTSDSSCGNQITPPGGGGEPTVINQTTLIGCGNGVCDSGENALTCPLDCKSVFETLDWSMFTSCLDYIFVKADSENRQKCIFIERPEWLYIVLLIVLIIIFAYYSEKRKKRKGKRTAFQTISNKFKRR